MRVPFRIVLKRNWLTNRQLIDTKARNLCLAQDSLDHQSLKVLFFGTDTFSLSSLKLLHNEWKNKRSIETLDVVTSFRAKINPVKDFATQENLKIFNFKEIKMRESLDYHMGLVVSFGHMIPEGLIRKFPLGLLNVHGSLLPKYRGAAPIIHAIRNGDQKTGITIMRIAPNHFDIGDILLQREFPLNDTELMPVIHDYLATEGAKMLIECMNNLPFYLGQAKPQVEKEATYAPKIDDNFTQVRWDKMTAKDVHNLHRSIFSFKFVTTFFHNDMIRLKEISFEESQVPEETSYQPGFIKYSYKLKCLKIFCADGKAIHVHSLGSAKKRQMSAKDFNNGFLSKRPESERIFS